MRARAVENHLTFWYTLVVSARPTMVTTPGTTRFPHSPPHTVVEVWLAPCQSPSTPNTTGPVCQLKPTWPPKNPPFGAIVLGAEEVNRRPGAAGTTTNVWLKSSVPTL